MVSATTCVISLAVMLVHTVVVRNDINSQLLSRRESAPLLDFESCPELRLRLATAMLHASQVFKHHFYAIHSLCQSEVLVFLACDSTAQGVYEADYHVARRCPGITYRYAPWLTPPALQLW